MKRVLHEIASGFLTVVLVWGLTILLNGIAEALIKSDRVRSSR